MEVRDTLRIFLQRWRVIAMGLLALIIATTALATRARPQYQATWTVLLTPPGSAASPAAAATGALQNPLLGENASLNVATRITAASVSDGVEGQRLAQLGASTTYTAAPGAQISDSTIDIAALDTDDHKALRTVEELAKAVQNDLTDRQKAFSVPTSDLITSHPIGAPHVSRFNKNAIRLLAAAAAGGTALVMLAVFAVEGWSRRRSLRRSSAALGIIGSLSTLRRRWYLCVLSFIIAMGSAGGVVKRIQPTYRADSTLLVVPPHIPPNPAIPLANQGTQNALLSFDRSFNVAAQLATILVTGPDAVAKLARQGGSATYQVRNWQQIGNSPIDTTSTPTPVVLVSATANSPSDANRTVAVVDRAFTDAMDTLQANIPPGTRIRVQIATPPETSTIRPSRVRLLAALATLGLVSVSLFVRIGDRVLGRLAAPRRGFGSGIDEAGGRRHGARSIRYLGIFLPAPAATQAAARVTTPMSNPPRREGASCPDRDCTSDHGVRSSHDPSRATDVAPSGHGVRFRTQLSAIDRTAKAMR